MSHEQVTDGPVIQTFQFDTDNIGDVHKNVNVFRGDVNIPLELVKLPGRHGLDVNISLLYLSNVRHQVDQTNRDAPPGAVGLGWDLPFERIEVDRKNSGSPYHDDYYLSAGDSRSLLVRIPTRWVRVERLAVSEEQLRQMVGSAPSQELLDAFAIQGIPLSRQSRVSAAEESWRIDDPRLEQSFVVRKADGGAYLEVLDGGIAYELMQYKFWRIRYYQRYERWAITKENGETTCFGGGLGSDGAVSTSLRNSIQWSVRWGNWIGDSITQEGQQQAPSAWNAVCIENLWGEQVQFQYEQTTQTVGPDGLPYTKACYLAAISDSYGRRAKFSYKPLQYEGDAPDAVREYEDPRKPTPNDTPDAYQSRYETQYLDAVRVVTEHGTPLYDIQFDYAVRNVSRYPQSDRRYGSSFKRFLTGIRFLDPDGHSLPGLRFDYVWDRDEHLNRGALHRVTYPNGATVTYEYDRLELSGIRRDRRIENPDGHRPRVWFGPDYAVVAWVERRSNKLVLSVFSWLAGWYEWKPQRLNYDQPVDIESLNVHAGAQAFCLLFRDQGDDKFFHCDLFHRNERCPGAWIEHRVGPLWRDAPAVAMGERFVVLAYRPGRGEPRRLRRLTWRWQTQGWDEEKLDGQRDRRYMLTGRDNYYGVLTLDETSGRGGGQHRFQVFYHNDLGHWIKGPSAALSLDLPEDGYLQLVPGDCFVALTAVTQRNPTVDEPADFETRVFRWDERSPEFLPVDDWRKRTIYRYLPELGPHVWSTSVVAVAPDPKKSYDNLLRLDGGVWRSAQMTPLEIHKPSEAGAIRWCAAGPDYFLYSENASGDRQRAELQVFDPNTQTWSSQVLRPADSGRGRESRYFAASGGRDYLLFDRNLYARGRSTDWSEAGRRVIYALGEDAVTTSVVMQAPSFLVYALTPRRGEPTTEVVLLEGGDVVRDFEPGNERPPVQKVTLSGQRLYQPFHDGNRDPFPQGKIAAGPGAFYSFESEDNDPNNATAITLYRHADDTVTGTLSVQVVSAITVFDGVREYRSEYEYFPEAAAVEASGTVAKFYKVRVWPGYLGAASAQRVDESARSRENGYTEHHFVRGLPEDYHRNVGGAGANVGKAADPVNGLLDGAVLQMITKDAAEQVVETERFEWEHVKGGLDGARVRGGYTRPREERKTQDGVETVQSLTYDDRSGQLRRVKSFNYNARGEREELVTDRTPGHDVYAWLRQHNILHATAQEIQRTAGAVTSASAKPWRGWAHKVADEPDRTVWSQAATLRWQGGTGSPDFDFAGWEPGTCPAAWWRELEAIRRGAYGLVLESLTAAGLYQTMRFDRAGKWPVASFLNGSDHAQEVDYYGFEATEENPGWTISGCDIVGGISHTGLSSLRIPPGASASRALTPKTQDRRYFFSCWYRSPEAGSGMRVELRRQGQRLGEPVEVAFEACDGQWRYASTVIALPEPGAQPVSVHLTLVNTTSGAMHIDSVRFSPLECEFRAFTHDAGLDLRVVESGPFHQVERSIFDRHGQALASVGPVENVGLLRARHISRHAPGNQDQFSIADPNATFSFAVNGASVCHDYGREPAWQRHWEGNDTRWKVDRGKLRHQGSAVDTLTLRAHEQGRERGILIQCEALRPSKPLGLKLGALVVQYQPGTGRWELLDGGQLRQSTEAARLATDWLLLALPDALLFFAGGQRVFSYVPAGPAEGAIQLFAADPLAVARVAAFEDPQVAAVFTNGTSKTLQIQTLSDGGAVVEQTILDTASRTAVATRQALMPVAAATPFGRYRDGFAHMDWDTETLRGEIVAYYRGQEGRSDDGGYPYSRTVFEASKLSRPVELSAPGADFAIGSGRTIRMSYGKNAQDEALFGPLPPGQYRTTTAVDEDGTRTVEVKDRRDAVVMSALELNDGEWIRSSTEVVFNGTGKQVHERLPNAWANPEDRDRWTAVKRFDMLDRCVEMRDPDAEGPARLCYDDAGRVRFAQDPENAAQGVVRYTRYDALGRATEAGLVERSWDDAELARLAANPAEPADGQWRQRFFYDEGGVNGYGHLSRVLVRGPEGELDVEEGYGYDRQGQVVHCSIRVPSFDTHTHTLHYRYDNAGRLTETRYGDDGPTLHQGYDGQGRLATIGRSAAKPADIARYGYDAEGHVICETLGEGAGRVERQRRFNGRGWLESIRDPYFEQTLHYLRDADGGDGYATGLVAELTSRFHVPDAPAGFVAQWSSRNQYDRCARLQAAIHRQAGTVVPAFSLGLSRPITYDHDGSTQQMQWGQKGQPGHRALHYARQEGSHKLTAVTDDTAGTERFQHDRNGSVTAVEGRYERFEYDPMNRKAHRMVLAGGAEVRFVHDGTGERVLKITPDEKRLYLRGAGEMPVAELIRSTDGGQQMRWYVHGAGGLTATADVSGGELTGLQWVLTDHLGSTRAVVDGTTGQALFACNYLPHGDVLGDVFGSTALRYRFTGHEWEPETGLYNCRARLYDPMLGVFYSVDPAEEFANPYLYAGNNPLNAVDPDGRAVTAGAVALSIVVFSALFAAIGAALGGVKAGIEIGQAKASGWEAFGIIAKNVGLGATVGAASGAFAGIASVATGGWAIAGALVVAGVAETAIQAGEAAARAGLEGKSLDEVGWAALGGAAAGAVSGGIGIVTGGATRFLGDVLKASLEIGKSTTYATIKTGTKILGGGLAVAHLGVSVIGGAARSGASGAARAAVAGKDAGAIGTAALMGAGSGAVSGFASSVGGTVWKVSGDSINAWAKSNVAVVVAAGVGGLTVYGSAAYGTYRGARWWYNEG